MGEAGDFIYCTLCVLPICHEAEFLPEHAHEEENGDVYHGWCWKVVVEEKQGAEETPYHDNSGTSNGYREAMRDAGRGHLLRE